MRNQNVTGTCIYIYIYICMYVYIYIYIYMYMCAVKIFQHAIKLFSCPHLENDLLAFTVKRKDVHADRQTTHMIHMIIDTLIHCTCTMCDVHVDMNIPECVGMHTDAFVCMNTSICIYIYTHIHTSVSVSASETRSCRSYVCQLRLLRQSAALHPLSA